MRVSRVLGVCEVEIQDSASGKGVGGREGWIESISAFDLLRGVVLKVLFVGGKRSAVHVTGGLCKAC
jgi:hypothetical protein